MKKYVEIVVLDYNEGVANIHGTHLPVDEDGFVQIEEVEKYLFDNIGYKEDEISYMYDEKPIKINKIGNLNPREWVIE